MPPEPATKRLIAFFDGQALYRSAKDAYGYNYPNYDVQKLSHEIASKKGWRLVKTHFYTGIPDYRESALWHDFWAAKLAVMGTRGIQTFSRPVRYANEIVRLNDGSTQTVRVGHEKGIDVRIALDVVRLALDGAYDVALIFSQDQDLSEVADEVRAISAKQRRWIKVASAFPTSSSYNNRRGINNTEWVPIDKLLYDTCIDPIDYRPRPRFNPLLP
jgi:uncharacterized LabA/DUF88 family protein